MHPFTDSDRSGCKLLPDSYRKRLWKLHYNSELPHFDICRQRLQCRPHYHDNYDCGMHLIFYYRPSLRRVHCYRDGN